MGGGGEVASKVWVGRGSRVVYLSKLSFFYCPFYCIHHLVFLFFNSVLSEDVRMR